jgi:hypothetical protein
MFMVDAIKTSPQCRSSDAAGYDGLPPLRRTRRPRSMFSASRGQPDSLDCSYRLYHAGRRDMTEHGDVKPMRSCHEIESGSEVLRTVQCVGVD